MLNSGPAIESGWEALGQGDLDGAAQVADNLLREVPRAAGRWDEGNLIHMGHLLLGHVALRRGNTEEAARRLLEAGRTPGSPQLDSFGPNMSLAAALLEEGQRDLVLAYLDECERFWTVLGKSSIRRWRRAIQRGEAPDFGANLVLGARPAARPAMAAEDRWERLARNRTFQRVVARVSRHGTRRRG